MKLKSCIKGYKKGTHRAVPPEETFTRVDPKMPAAGVTRVADITGLDRIGIPVFSSIRPYAEGGAISVYNGKGTTADEARVSAMMEAIERYSAEVRDSELLVDSYSELSAKENALNPRDLILPDYVKEVEDVRIPWVEGYDLMKDEEIYVPANAVFHPLPSRYDRVRLFRANTNGLAGGNELEEAIFHGLAEVIERDAWSLVEITRNTGPAVNIDGGGEIRNLIDNFLNADVSVLIRDITSDICVPTFAAVSDDQMLRDPTLLTIGMGTHTNASVAIMRAVTEVAQSRLTQIHGAREDTTTADVRRIMGYEWMRKQNEHWFEISKEEDLESVESFSVDNDDFLEDIKHVTARLKAGGLERLIVVDLTREEIGVPVVRVIVPGLEMYGVDGERIGRRCRNARKKSSRVPGTES
ncbi:MAG TPA: YcaO-related McrA-glycine thioamidation protein [Candidatus Bathyarchaeia archaeon]|nr:YcaO-related McrA-glycine thioamidation protein [Candidatus Bathyarchaeia archaeon]